MSLMSKLSATILLGASLFAATNAEVEQFLKNSISKNPNVSDLKVEVLESRALSEPKGWEAFIVSLNAKIEKDGKKNEISQNMVYFAKDNIITRELTDIKTGQSLKDRISAEFDDAYYTKANLISGNEKSKHKVAIFSDPLCPFCRGYVPEAIEYMKKYPETFAIYYYHLPLEQLHPAAPTITKAATAAELKGAQDVLMQMYKIPMSITRESNESKILDLFNKTLNTSLKLTDINSPMVKAHIKSDLEIANALMVNGTPTIFFDGQKDGSKTKYKEVKVK